MPEGDWEKERGADKWQGRRQRSGRLALGEYRETREGLLKAGWRKPNKCEEKIFERKECCLILIEKEKKKRDSSSFAHFHLENLFPLCFPPPTTHQPSPLAHYANEPTHKNPLTALQLCFIACLLHWRVSPFAFQCRVYRYMLLSPPQIMKLLDVNLRELMRPRK